MSQFKYDLAEFIINNREYILESLNEQTEYLEDSKRMFSKAPGMYEELLATAKMSKLQEYLMDHFPNEIENILLLLDQEFVNITLYS